MYNTCTYIYLSHGIRVDDAPLNPARQDDNGLTLLKVGVPGLLHLGHAAADHGEGRVHPLSVGPHVRVNTQEQSMEQNLIFLKKASGEEKNYD